jgi:hypothetical protein
MLVPGVILKYFNDAMTTLVVGMFNIQVKLGMAKQAWPWHSLYHSNIPASAADGR